MLNQFSRTELLFGKEAMEKLANSRVAVFGIGGVGGYTVEALVRSGIGKLMEEENREKIAKTLKVYGFTYVTLDLMGYRTGSMNETL